MQAGAGSAGKECLVLREFFLSELELPKTGFVVQARVTVEEAERGDGAGWVCPRAVRAQKSGKTQISGTRTPFRRLNLRELMDLRLPESEAKARAEVACVHKRATRNKGRHGSKGGRRLRILER